VEMDRQELTCGWNGARVETTAVASCSRKLCLVICSS